MLDIVPPLVQVLWPPAGWSTTTSSLVLTTNATEGLSAVLVLLDASKSWMRMDITGHELSLVQVHTWLLDTKAPTQCALAMVQREGRGMEHAVLASSPTIIPSSHQAVVGLTRHKIVELLPSSAGVSGSYVLRVGMSPVAQSFCRLVYPILRWWLPHPIIIKS